MVISLVFRFPSKLIIRSLNVEKSQVRREGVDTCGRRCYFSGFSCTPPPTLTCRVPVPVSLSPLRNLTMQGIFLWRYGGMEAALFELPPFAQRSHLAVRNRHLFLSPAPRAPVEAHPSALRSQLSHVHSCVVPWAVVSSDLLAVSGVWEPGHGSDGAPPAHTRSAPTSPRPRKTPPLSQRHSK